MPIIPEYLYNLEHPNETAEIKDDFRHSMYNNSPMINASLKKFKENWKNAQMNRLSTKVGLMFASKPIVQLITNPFIGPLTNRYFYYLIKE